MNGVWGNEPDGENDIACIRVADFSRNELLVSIDTLTYRSVDPREAAMRGLSPGDLLIEKSGGGDKQPVGAVVMFDHGFPAVPSNYIGRIRLKPGFGSRFMTYVFSALYDSRVNTRSIKQTTGIQNIDLRSYLNERFVFPSAATQRAIARYLDRETARIDALIEKKQRQIELLQEKRQAIITHAVTKGLDPNARMKDSGVEWIGEIPEGWCTPPLYALYSLKLGKMLDSKTITGESLVPYLRNQDVKWGRISTDDLPTMDIDAKDRANLRLHPGDLLVCEGGEIGKAAIWKGEVDECYFQKALHRLRPLKRESKPEYLYYCMFAFAHLGAFNAQAPTNTIAHLTGEKLRRMRFPNPSGSVQRAIAEHLDQHGQRIDHNIRLVQRSQDILRELRSSLITAAVTGQIDVSADMDEDD